MLRENLGIWQHYYDLIQLVRCFLHVQKIWKSKHIATLFMADKTGKVFSLCSRILQIGRFPKNWPGNAIHGRHNWVGCCLHILWFWNSTHLAKFEILDNASHGWENWLGILFMSEVSENWLAHVNRGTWKQELRLIWLGWFFFMFLIPLRK